MARQQRMDFQNKFLRKRQFRGENLPPGKVPANDSQHPKDPRKIVNWTEHEQQNSKK
jgi:hypothetical protein